MCLDLFTQAHVHHLTGAIRPNIRRYVGSARPWADRPARVCLPTDLAPAIPLDFTMPGPGRGQHYDFDNAVMLHQAFPDLTPAMASDPRLWTRLCHVEGWQYMRRRWPVLAYRQQQDQKYAQRREQGHADDPGWVERQVVGYIREHYFVAGSRPSRALTRNGVARLWWFAKVTYDPSRGDPYELTRVLVGLQDTAQTVLERNFGRSRHLLNGFLQHLIDAREQIGEGRPRREHVRHLAIRLNLRGGFTLLDMLDSNGVRAFLADTSRRYVARLAPPQD